ncbi:glycosyltransferase family 2 protein [Aminobacter sp. HY435]|uniref:glycosyltransferase family 2 protein n=1 Tax=Aminobacter sp. HY435 TaxID=2970917 RepID=UPI0022B9A5A7|nr:glycosyltransferase [Aminobacter sp. HY435]
MSGTDVCVIIAARNAADTIATAIASALGESEVAEVVVVDDASGDATEAAARAADDGSGRLLVLRLDVNRGPSFARNLAIRHSRSPLIGILDADDFFLPGRLRCLCDGANWDMAADNIVFIGNASSQGLPMPDGDAETAQLGFNEFVAGNISRRGAARGELGFLKPLLRRSFLERHGLRYDENLRLGEDYELYARALLKGARFRLTRSCGYAAVVRAGSLSGRHRTEDLRRLAGADLALLQTATITAGERRVLRRHERHMRDKYRLRHFLDLKSQEGALAALGFALASPANLRAVALGVAQDKYDALRVAPQQQPQVRYLLPTTENAEARK